MCPVPPLFPAKSSTAAALACHYGGAYLSVDAVVTDVLVNGTSPVSLTARHLYDCAAAEYAEKKAEEAGKHKIWSKYGYVCVCLGGCSSLQVREVACDGQTSNAFPY